MSAAIAACTLASLDLSFIFNWCVGVGPSSTPLSLFLFSASSSLLPPPGHRLRKPLRLDSSNFVSSMRRIIRLIILLFIAAPLSQAKTGEKCYVTDEYSLVPFGLDLCYMHSHNACCLTAFDQDIKTAYLAVVAGGTGCKGGNQRIYSSLYSLREYLCLPCDPKEPSYRFESVKGDIVDGGIVPPSTNSVAGDQTWRICHSFLYGKPGSNQGLWGNNGARYSECGILLYSCQMTPVFNIATAEFEEVSSTCKAARELVIPSVALRESSDPGLDMLLRVAQTMSDFQIVVVNDSDPSYDYSKTPCFGRSVASPHPRSVAAGLLPVFLVTAFHFF